MSKKSVSSTIRQKNEALILASAKKEFVEYGFKGASLKRIAERAELPRANIHYYFEDKTALYRQLLKGIIETWNTRFDTFDEKDDPKQAISEYIRSKVMYSKTDPEASRIFASEIIHGAVMLDDYLSSEFKDWIQKKVEVIEGWIKKGLMDAVNPYHLLFLIWSSTQHYADFNVQVIAALNKTEMQDSDFDEVADSLTAIILKGCGIH